MTLRPDGQLQVHHVVRHRSVMWTTENTSEEFHAELHTPLFSEGREFWHEGTKFKLWKLRSQELAKQEREFSHRVPYAVQGIHEVGGSDMSIKGKY